MAITSLEFLGFCVASIILFIIFPKKYRWIALLISSVAFYLISAQTLIFFMIFTSVSVWAASLLIDHLHRSYDIKLGADGVDKKQKKTLRQELTKKKRVIVVIALILNIGILVAFKVFNYFTAAFVMVASIFSGGTTSDALVLIVPLGISYYTFSTIGYLLDVYWKRYGNEKNPVRFFLYTIYFPHIVQGPISRYNLLGMQLKKPELKFTWDNFVVGLERILLGCFKKLVIADRCNVFVSATLMQSDMNGGIYLLALILDAFQLYMDFSGYVDIVAGVSRMFDVELEENFNHPFLATSVPDFWRRWHMSLGGWFRDYVYYPMTVSKGIKKLNKNIMGWKKSHLRKLVGICIPVLVTWLLTGLWHGTGYGYVLWGVYYGVLIALSVTLSDIVDNFYEKHHINRDSVPYRVFRTAKIFVIFMGGRFLGTPMTLEHRGEIFRQIFTSFSGSSIFSCGLDKKNFLIIIIGVAAIICIAVIVSKKGDLFTWFNSKNRIFCAIVIWIVFFAVFLLGIYGGDFGSGNFMYQQY